MRLQSRLRDAVRRCLGAAKRPKPAIFSAARTVELEVKLVSVNPILASPPTQPRAALWDDTQRKVKFDLGICMDNDLDAAIFIAGRTVPATILVPLDIVRRPQLADGGIRQTLDVASRVSEEHGRGSMKLLASTRLPDNV
jgi:hypothetical protein